MFSVLFLLTNKDHLNNAIDWYETLYQQETYICNNALIDHID